jgi:GMP synthase-like glutamine amidotransferase
MSAAIVPRRIGLLLCGHIHPAAVDLGGDYRPLFDGLLARHGIELVTYDADLGHLPESVDECDGWITSPGRPSVTDDDQWIADTQAFVRAVVEAEQPFVGICFGHQLLAQAMGGRVERAADGWGVGAQTYEVVATEPWMTPAVPRFELIASHEDQVVALPPGAHLLATAEYCPNAMFALGDRAFGIQPHPELTAAHSTVLLAARRDLVGPARADAALATLDRPLDRDLVAGWIARFLSA